MTRVLQHRVRYHEADAQGFMFNSRFLELADVALTEYLRLLGWPYHDMVQAGVDPSVVKATVDFKAPARFDDLLDLDTECDHVGTSSFSLTTTISREADLIAVTSLVYVNVDAQLATAQPLTAEIADALRAGIHAIPPNDEE